MPRPAVLVDIITIDARVESHEMLQRLRTLALAGAALREVTSGPIVTVDTHFDPDFHVRLETLPSPRSMRELKRLAARLVTEPFDTSRPGWTIHYIEKLARTRSALIVRRLADHDERVLGALTGMPVNPVVTAESSGFDYAKLLGLAQRLLAQPDPVNVIVDQGAAIAARVMQEFDKSGGSRSPIWRDRSGSLEHQDLRIEHLAVQRAAANLNVDERAIILALFAESLSRLHQSNPVDTLQCGVAMRRRDASRLADVSLPTSTMPFAERALAVHELLIHLPQQTTQSSEWGSIDLGSWMPPALSALLDRRRSQEIDVACVFAEPMAPLNGVGMTSGTLLPYVSLLGAAISLIATVDGDAVRLGFSVDKASGTNAEQVHHQFEEMLRTQLGVTDERNWFSRWWATLQRQSATA